MKINHHNTAGRRSIRLPEYDYSQTGMYYITICSHEQKCIFGKVINEKMIPNKLGETVISSWEKIHEHFSHVKTDQFVLMPNHIHGILNIEGFQKTSDEIMSGTSRTVGSVVRCLKICVTRWAKNNSLMDEIWQRGFYEHVIRDDRDYIRIAEYIANNPLKWELDSLHREYDDG